MLTALMTCACLLHFELEFGHLQHTITRASLVQLCHTQHTNKHKHITSSWVCPLPTLLLCTKAILSYTTTTTSTS